MGIMKWFRLKELSKPIELKVPIYCLECGLLLIKTYGYNEYNIYTGIGVEPYTKFRCMNLYHTKFTINGHI